MNKIIRHAKSSKIKYDGKVLNPLSIEGVLAAIDYAKIVYAEDKREKEKFIAQELHDEEDGCMVQYVAYEPVIYTFDRSPQIRAIQTSEAIAYGLKQIEPGLESRLVFNAPDPRLDIVNFLKGHSPGDVGDHKAYTDCIDLTPDEVYNVAAKFAAYMIDNAKRDHVIAVSHDVAMNIFLYLFGITEYDSPPIPSLSGFSYKLIGNEFWLQTHYDDKQYSVPYADLKEVSENRVNERLKAIELK